MISRSESLPITIETSGLLINLPTNYLCLERSPRNVLPVMRPVKPNLLASLISPLHRSLQLRRPCRHPEHPPAGCVKRPIALRGARVKYFHTVNSARFFEPRNLLPHVKRPRISSRRHHHARRRIA